MKNNPKKSEKRETEYKKASYFLQKLWVVILALMLDLARVSKSYNSNNLQSKKGDAK